MTQEKSIIELVGLGTIMSWTFIDENQWKLLQTEGPEQDELLQQLIDTSLNDNVFSGCHFEDANLYINGELVCKSFLDMIDQYTITSHPLEKLIEFADKPYCFVQDEIHRGVWGHVEVDGEIDHSKFHFHVSQTDLPKGHDSLSADYDGEELDSGDTYTKSGDWYVLDREGNRVESEICDSQPENDQPATDSCVPLINPFGLGDPERNEAIDKARALIDEFGLTPDDVFVNALEEVTNNPATNSATSLDYNDSGEQT